MERWYEFYAGLLHTDLLLDQLYELRRELPLVTLFSICIASSRVCTTLPFTVNSRTLQQP